jgi:hypothetical protein
VIAADWQKAHQLHTLNPIGDHRAVERINDSATNYGKEPSSRSPLKSLLRNWMGKQYAMADLRLAVINAIGSGDSAECSVDS